VHDREAMKQRFEYDRLSAEDLLNSMGILGLTGRSFAVLTKTNPEVVSRWCEGTSEIPHWVTLVVRLLLAYREHGSLAVARQVTADMIRIDLKYPNRGQHPYRMSFGLLEEELDAGSDEVCSEEGEKGTRGKNRFEYDRLTFGDFDNALRTLRMRKRAFERLTKTNYETMRRWRKGISEIPHWVTLVVRLLLDYRERGSLAVARRVAADMICIDLKYPNRGQYPYRRNLGLLEEELDGGDDGEKGENREEGGDGIAP
jgi:hypothetical protein